jgi:D-glycero-alpha-D-manno-heptose 1-phosphate guanylyltransferase
MECIVLAGGFGTRLQTVVNDVPKCLAPVAGKPFLHWLTQYLLQQGITKFIFSVGYKKEFIIDWAKQELQSHEYVFCEEDEPLGTGGAIKRALSFCKTNHVFATNGDTYFHIDPVMLYNFHVQHKALCSLGLKEMDNYDRYGTVVLNNNNLITQFLEKQFTKKGFINGGFYIIDKEQFSSIDFAEKFSFEKDFLELHLISNKLYGQKQNGYFIDIGIPEDFEKANEYFKQFKYVDN